MVKFEFPWRTVSSNLATRTKAGLPLMLAAIVSVLTISALGVAGAGTPIQQAAAASQNNPGNISGSGAGSVFCNNDYGAPIPASITFSTVTMVDSQGKKFTGGTMSITANTGNIGTGVITAAKFGNDGYTLTGKWGPNGICGFDRNTSFTIRGNLGIETPIIFISKLPGGGCIDGSFMGSVQPTNTSTVGN